MRSELSRVVLSYRARISWTSGRNYVDRLSLLRPTAVVRVSVLPAASCGAFPLLPLLDRMIIAGTEICGNVKSPNSLHEALFFGLYSKLLAFCLERGKSLLHIEVRTDRVDDPIFKNFQAAAKSLLDYGAKIQTVTGFDPDTEKVVRGTIETPPVPSKQQLPITITQLDFKRAINLDGLVLAADVLARRATKQPSMDDAGDGFLPMIADALKHLSADGRMA